MYNCAKSSQIYRVVYQHFVILFDQDIYPMHWIDFCLTALKRCNMKYRFFSLLILVILAGIPFFSAIGQSAGITEKIIASIKKADATGLSAYFNSTIDLEVGETDGNFSKKQAEVILRDFFGKHPVQSFSVNHNGSSNDGSQYMIGSYSCKSNKKFRVYILLKNSNSNLLITQLQFEED